MPLVTEQISTQAEAEEAAILLQRYRDTAEALRQERDELKKQLERQEAVIVRQQSLISATEEQADRATAALDAITGVLDKEGIDVSELHLIAARARAAQDPAEVLEAMPRDLRVIFAGLDPQLPRAAEIALSRLRTGSVALLEDFGVASFSDADGDGVMDVTLSSRAWDVAKLARQWLLDSKPAQ